MGFVMLAAPAIPADYTLAVGRNLPGWSSLALEVWLWPLRVVFRRDHEILRDCDPVELLGQLFAGLVHSAVVALVEVEDWQVALVVLRHFWPPFFWRKGRVLRASLNIWLTLACSSSLTGMNAPL